MGTDVTHCRASTTLSSSRSPFFACHLTYHDVQQRQLLREARADAFALDKLRVLCFDPRVHDHHGQASLLAVELPDPAVLRLKSRCLDPPGRVIGQPESRRA